MQSSIKMATSLWLLLLLTPSVISRSFLTTQSNEKHYSKRLVAADETDSTKPDITNFDVTSHITYRYAVTTISSRVANPKNESQEISFHVTLPDSAFISKFLMVIKDNVYTAYVKEKEVAKKEYQEAVNQGNTAGLVSISTRDSNVFTVSVNVEAHGKVTFNLTYEQLLTRTLGQYENNIVTNPGQIVKNFNVHVNIEESSNITFLQVSDLKSSNEIDSQNTKRIDAKIDRPTGHSAKISWSPDSKEQAELSANGVAGQFIVRYDVDHSSQPNQILVDEGYFVHFYAPTDLKPLAKHVLFVLDISASMSGRKIEQLREALTLILADIGEDDYFSIILFSSSVQVWTLNGLDGNAHSGRAFRVIRTTQTDEINEKFIIRATHENIKKATEFAKTIETISSTNIIGGIRKSLEIAKWGQTQSNIKAKPLIIFLTDGEPNVEISDPKEIIKNVDKLNSDKFPVFSLGFGEGADFNFLRKLSLSNAGFARNIYVASDTTLQLKNFYKEVSSPLLSNVTFQYIPGQIVEDSVTKQTFKNLYNGSELVVAGKLSNSIEFGGNLTYEGADGYSSVPLPTPTNISVRNPEAHLEKMFAYLHIRELLDKDVISDEKNSTYKQKALKLSLKYGFVTPLTSLVVVKPNETDSAASIKNSNASPRNDEKATRMSHSHLLSSRTRPAPGIAYSRPSSFSFSGAENSYTDLTAKARQAPSIALRSKVDVPVFPDHDFISTRAFIDQIDDQMAFDTPTHNLKDITWLQNKTEIRFPNSNNSYSVSAGDLPNKEYQSCREPNSNTYGHCRHLTYCVIPEILSSFQDFIPYGQQCIINARFVGICCPRKFYRRFRQVL